MNALKRLTAGFHRFRQSSSRLHVEAFSRQNLLLCVFVIIILCCKPDAVWMVIYLGMALLFTDGSDLDLVRRCANDPHNPVLWREFTRRYEGAIRQSILRTLQQQNRQYAARLPATVDDIVQDVYLRLLQHNGRAFQMFKGFTEAAWFRYLRVIARHLTLNHLRNNSAGKRPPINFSLDAGSDFDCERQLQGRKSGEHELTTDEKIRMLELHDQINHSLDLALRGPNKSRDKLLFQLHYFDGLSVEQIASFPGIAMTAHAVEVALSRVRQRLAHFVNRS
ncbi:MAG: sigma-70 family RNA polymerase sigma factor [candidate division KSB1 bacterium]|nr:sigma-70 family RNA polymerase sigma factor [candidate division KSB1 bacterium]MDZ7275187.1 sigma-70 family RNA polymerase sigma factor [candidate division KSB1 bacterium]MDZ7287356.1 sigma-70 family RNA polymerase sigma factor [candidate division KSB1 bacterium]MDZ7299470.1 sigma-70 family RNA polymerase sigma factor [candidate division KSB1 bacterium]MDZ7305484.1 sigma-70 family RNA polymerase sigma factor [candidate division KSB1 bacterium]